jgi:hypothetical protein
MEIECLFVPVLLLPPPFTAVAEDMFLFHQERVDISLQSF